MNILFIEKMEYPVTEREFRDRFPGASLPNPLTEECLASHGAAVVFQAPQPVFDAATEYISEGAPVKTAKGHWEQTWKVNKLSKEIIAERQEAADKRLELECEAAVQAHMEAEVQARGYDSLISVCSYATSTHKRYGADGKAAVAWRDKCWDMCYYVLADVKAGRQQKPTVQELVAKMPKVEWPK